MKWYIFPILGVLSMTVLATFWYFEKRADTEAVMTSPDPQRQAACEQFLTVALFPSGEAADEFMEACLRGEPVLPEDDPAEATEVPPVGGIESPGAHVGPGCAVGGCSSQLCGEADEMANVVTTCEYREEYACYAHTRCERQSSGQCGWTKTAALDQCLSGAARSY